MISLKTSYLVRFKEVPFAVKFQKDNNSDKVRTVIDKHNITKFLINS